jgi:tetratricopeptide (TPR) repeat protein
MLAALETSARNAPGDPELQFELGTRYLQLGRFDLGWDYYEWRLRVPRLFKPMPDAGIYWTGAQSLQGKTLLLAQEQGLGDTIQFVRYVPLLKAHGVRILLGLDRSLGQLMGALPGVEQVLVGDDPLPDFDFKCMLLSLGQRFGLAPDAVPVQPPYLFAAPEAVENFRALLNADRPSTGAARKRLRIGITCSGNAKHGRDGHRSIPLERFAPLFGADREVHLVQNSLRAEDHAALARYAIVDHRHRLHTMTDTAALVACLDVVISVDTSVAHLCGAMNIPLLLLLDTEPDWRWQLDRLDSPWYPSAQLFRQSVSGDWEEPVARVSAWLDRPTHDTAPPRRTAMFGVHPQWPIRPSDVLPPDLLAMLKDLAGRHGHVARIGDALALQSIIAEYRNLLRYDADWFDLQRLMGIALLQDGQLAEALAHTERALALKPDSSEARILRSAILSQLGRNSEVPESR